MDMKCLVVVVALVVHQVVGQGSTELVTKASNEFSNKLYKAVGEKPGNVLVCPVSLHVALALLHQAAGGTTATQMEQVLRLPASNAAKANIRDSYKALLSGIKDNVLKIATKMYPAEGFKLNNDYVTVAREYFLSDVESINYNNPANAANKINKYVEEKTNNKIHDLISPDSISGLTRLIIINAVHFQATWKTPFSPAYTDYFKISPTQRVQTQMMTQTDFFDYKEDEHLDAKVLKMDYNTGGYSMVFILPNKEDGLHALEGKLATMPLTETLSDMKETKVEVSIPKFKLEQKIDLKERLIQMGLTEIFEPRADLRGLANENNLYVSDVIQKTYINVHENGTEAAAATAYLETLSAASINDIVFRARRPFHMMLIISNTTNLVLFEGRFELPLDGVPEPIPTTTPRNVQTPLQSRPKPPQSTQRPSLQSAQRPQQSSQPSLQSEKNPQQSSQPSLQNAQRPQQSSQPSLQSAQNPQHSTQPSLQSAQRPQQSMQPSLPSAQNPQQSAQPSLQSTQKPQDAVQFSLQNAQSPQHSAQPSLQSGNNPEHSAQPSGQSTQPIPSEANEESDDEIRFVDSVENKNRIAINQGSVPYQNQRLNINNQVNNFQPTVQTQYPPSNQQKINHNVEKPTFGQFEPAEHSYNRFGDIAPQVNPVYQRPGYYHQHQGHYQGQQHYNY